MIDFRTLCAELANDLEEWVEGYLINDHANEFTSASFGLIDRARAALAEPQPAAEGEVAATPDRSLEPIPVSERLPEAEDCDAEGKCWLLTVEDEYPQWRLHSIEGAQPGGAMIWVPVDSSPGVMVDCFFTSHWLPAHALPLPKEVQ